MTFLMEAALRTSAPVLAALLACLLLRRRSAALRHRVLAAGLIAAALVVPLSVLLPSWRVQVSAESAEYLSVPAAPLPLPGDAAVTARASAIPAAPATVPQVMFVLWIAGVVVGSGAMLLGVARLARLTMGADPVEDGCWRRSMLEIAAMHGVRRHVVLLTTRASDVLATWGVFKPLVLLPAHAHTWSEERVRVALGHELAHIGRCDWAVQMAAELLRTVFWFNPLLWMLCARLRREAEFACDDMVLDSGIAGPTTYASHLLDIARACRPSASRVPALPIARPSTLERRITAMLNTHLNRQVPARRATAVIVGALAAIVLSSASFGLSAQAPGPGELAGYVYDSSGGVLPGVEVTLTGRQEAARSAVTDGTGQFRFSSVAGGTYVLEATLPGFRTLRNELVLAAPRDWTRNITMQVGEVEETIRVTAKRPAQTVPLAQAAGRANPVRVGGSIKAPTKLKDVPPVYPPALRDAGLEGLVPMDALIGRDGTVASVRVLSAEVHPEFARSAEEAVRQWVFSPTLLNNVPVEVQMTVSVQFRLED